MQRRRLLGTAAAGCLLAACDAPDSTAYVAWQDPPAFPGDPRRAILARAILAPSPLNTQPWLVELPDRDRILLRSDPLRALPAHDPDGRQARLALGCFVELAALAAAARGRRLAVGGGEVLELLARPDPDLRPDPLHQAVPQRRTSRRAFDLEKPITAAHAAALVAAAGAGVGVGFATAPEPVAELRALTAGAQAAARALPAVAAERARWLRLGPDEVAVHGDGIAVGGAWAGWARRAGLISAPRIVGAEGVAAGVDRLFWENLFAGTASFGWLVTAGDGAEARLAAGRAYQRLDLTAAALGVAIHPVSEALGDVLELAGARAELERQLAVEPPARVQMLFRLGYAGPQPPSPRRPLQAIIAG